MPAGYLVLWAKPWSAALQPRCWNKMIIPEAIEAWFRGHGVAEATLQAPTTPDTVFRVASLTKTFRVDFPAIDTKARVVSAADAS